MGKLTFVAIGTITLIGKTPAQRALDLIFLANFLFARFVANSRDLVIFIAVGRGLGDCVEVGVLFGRGCCLSHNFNHVLILCATYLIKE